jgi:hypothetical protein
LSRPRSGSTKCKKWVGLQTATFWPMKRAAKFISSTRPPIVRGYDPTWSPDWRMITYRSVDQVTARVTPDGTHLDWPGGHHQMIGGVRWSPDGHYVLFSEEVHNPVPIVGAYYRLVVCRMKDGATVAIRDFGAGSRHAFLFHWILNYRTFCASCKAGDPFN